MHFAFRRNLANEQELHATNSIICDDYVCYMKLDFEQHTIFEQQIDVFAVFVFRHVERHLRDDSRRAFTFVIDLYESRI